MDSTYPIVAFTIGMFNSIDGPAHCVYTQAYGMEMQFDDQWPLNVIIMCPPHLISSMTQEAEVASMGMIPGASYTPGDGDYEQISQPGGLWVLARESDDLQTIVQHQLGVLLVLEDEQDMPKLSHISGLSSQNLIVAFPLDSISTHDSAQRMAAKVLANLPSGCESAKIIVSASFEQAELIEYASIENVSGFLFLDASFDGVLEVIDQMVA